MTTVKKSASAKKPKAKTSKSSPKKTEKAKAVKAKVSKAPAKLITKKKTAAKSKAALKTQPKKTPAQIHPSTERTVKAQPEIKKSSAPVPHKPAAVVDRPAAESAAPKISKTIQIEMPITVGSLAQKLKVSVPVMIKSLMGIGIFANVNQLLNEEIVWKVSKALDVEIEKIEDATTKAVLEESKDDLKELKLRPPVVTLMGHVDHGKTSLLDAIRQSDVVARETGQITQHIGAYNVHIENKGLVTFLDTPGHKAFTAMRARGANVTDVVVLVVAADDGVMPQTVEAINHARAANVPIVVAINKSDLPAADANRVMKGLQKHDLMPEEWGGKTVCVKVSAKNKTGIDELLEMLLLEAEVLELKSNPNRSAQGAVIEAELSKGQGSMTTLLVQKGTLRVGDSIVVGPHYGKVKALKNDHGKSVKEAGPSYAVVMLGLSSTPEAGESFVAIKDEQTARKMAGKRSLELRERSLRGLHTKHMSLENLYSQVKEGRIKELKLIIKGDVQGSVGALTQSIEQIPSENIKLRVIHGGVGSISESDIMLAAASDAIVIGFHVKPDDRAQVLIEDEGVDVRFYNIIYEAIQDVQKAMEGLLDPTAKEVFEGRTEIRQIYRSSKIGVIGGAYVKKGKLIRNHPIRVLRDNIVVHQGKLASLKRFKDDVREVQEGYDCGVVVEGYPNLQERDVIESYRIDKVASSLA